MKPCENHLKLPKIAISIGDVNGISIDIAIRAHKRISQCCEPIYCAHRDVIESASALLGYEIDSTMQCVGDFSYTLRNLITPRAITAQSGAYSYESFMQGVRLAQSGECAALVTLPIHKKAWQKAGIDFIGHTDALNAYFGTKGIMMLGCEEMYVALFTEHIALSDVSRHISKDNVLDFLLRFANAISLDLPCCVLGLNPHCGDLGIMGNEDSEITQAIKAANAQLKKEIFYGAYPPDSAFSPQNRAKFTYFVSMYHDVGLAPLKALYFDQSINITLNLPILRTSVDHGVAYDKAYRADSVLNLQSYYNAIDYAIKRSTAL